MECQIWGLYHDGKMQKEGERSALLVQTLPSSDEQPRLRVERVVAVDSSSFFGALLLDLTSSAELARSIVIWIRVCVCVCVCCRVQ